MSDESTDDLEIRDLCEVIAGLTELQEGPEGVERIFRLIYENQPASPRRIAEKSGLPVPLVSAVRREFEKAGWLLRRGGMVLSPVAQDRAEALWGRVPARREPKKQEETATPHATGFMNRIMKLRPSPERSLDQSHATRKTLIRRAEHLIQEGLVPGKRVLFLGDDDLTSLSMLYSLRAMRGRTALESCRVTVVEIDSRLVEVIRAAGEEEHLPITVVEADLREGLPTGLEAEFDFFFTDPPYTAEGIDLFLDRGCQALRPAPGVQAALAVPLSPPDLQAATQGIIRNKGFVIDYLFPGFNHYLGATMQGGISALYGLTLRTPGQYRGEPWNGLLYTREVREK